MTDYYLWVKERATSGEKYHPMMGYEEPKMGRERMVPLQGKTVEEARAESIRKLDAFDGEGGFNLHMAVVYAFQENVTFIFEEDKGTRQAARASRIKKAELIRAEAEVARLKQELGEG